MRLLGLSFLEGGDPDVCCHAILANCRYDEELPIAIALLLVYGLACFIIALTFMTRSGSKSSGETKLAYGIFTISQVCRRVAAADRCQPRSSSIF